MSDLVVIAVLFPFTALYSLLARGKVISIDVWNCSLMATNLSIQVLQFSVTLSHSTTLKLRDCPKVASFVIHL